VHFSREWRDNANEYSRSRYGKRSHWRQGKVELEMNTGKRSIPFEYRDRSELDVVPVQNKTFTEKADVSSDRPAGV
jgi:hypothetical protein